MAQCGNAGRRYTSRLTTGLRYGLFAALALGLCGSCANSRCDPGYAGPEERPAEMLAYYSYSKRAIEVTVTPRKRRRKYDILRVEFPSAINVFGTEDIRVDYYRRKAAGRSPTVLLLPISGGVDFSVTSFASCFASNGFNCAIVYNRKAKIEHAESAEEVEAYFRQTVLDHRQVLDYLVTRPEVDADRLACLGLSLGGIKASLVAAVDDRIRCVVLGLAGGSIADITLHSAEDGIRDYINELKDRGADADLIYSELSEKVRTDPLKLAPYIDARKTLMFIAAFDRSVPRWCGEQLRRAIGKPETAYLLAGHYTSFLYLPYAQLESLLFLKRQFRVP